VISEKVRRKLAATSLSPTERDITKVIVWLVGEFDIDITDAVG
jgi:hypothetical protein